MSRFFCWFVGKKVPPPKMWSIGTYLVVFKMIRWSILMYNFFLWVVLLSTSRSDLSKLFYHLINQVSIYNLSDSDLEIHIFFNLFYKNIYWIKLHKIYLGTIEIRLYFIFLFQLHCKIISNDLNFGKMPKKLKCALIRENKSFTCRILCAHGIVRIILQILYWLA